ncbi:MULTISPECIES: carbon starvation CstA family protein [Halorubrum]|uniref:Carbon starvation protein n=1 Tax=Halorubrum sodomense TaxID=35743 RepID=A0A1I6FJW1_HALSD|nr:MULTISPECIES: carbon starvation CstA family protein [Halorubrum]TKX54054.1 carbon starvation protein A [Halorubrum sp. SP3]TKX69016.1 carbon starvation protein A [Halorubrum sp. SP9]SFR30243.1 carbon starvation protein [Halorubrum sodomense]
MTSVIWIVVAVLSTFTVGYVGYSRYLSRFVEIDDDRETPAHKYEDGQEYVPAKKPVLLGHHFSSIAGGAPIVGPITAGAIWGWVPALLWVAIGNPLMGAVHDFISLSGSMRHEGKSIGYIIGEYVGERGKNMLLWFAFLTIILVVAVFALVVGIVLNAFPSAATASLVYIALAFAFGVYLYQLDGPFLPGTVVFVAGVFAGVWLGIQYPLALFPAVETGVYPAGTIVLFEFLGNGAWLPGAVVSTSAILQPNVAAWVPVILVYATLASALPVWVLLQPRDYLSSFLLYSGVGGALLAIIVGTLLGTSAQPLTIDPSIGAYMGFFGSDLAIETRGITPLFPLLFVTIACGTISGFHSLVSSGTTAKQLNKESDARLIGYGGMLGEGLLASVAISTLAVAGATTAAAGGGIGGALPNFATGGGIILTSLGIPQSFGAPFMALVLVSFLLTSTDTAARLGRYMMEEIVGTRGSGTTTGFSTDLSSLAKGRYTNPIVQSLVAYLLVISGEWVTLWALFGGANQLLAALALLAATVWLANWDESKQLVSTGVPMTIMVTITVLGLSWVALWDNLYQKLIQGGVTGLGGQISAVVQMGLAFVLIYLALSLVWIGYGNITSVRSGGEPAAEPSDD